MCIVKKNLFGVLSVDADDYRSGSREFVMKIKLRAPRCRGILILSSYQLTTHNFILEIGNIISIKIQKYIKIR